MIIDDYKYIQWDGTREDCFRISTFLKERIRYEETDSGFILKILYSDITHYIVYPKYWIKRPVYNKKIKPNDISILSPSEFIVVLEEHERSFNKRLNILIDQLKHGTCKINSKLIRNLIKNLIYLSQYPNTLNLSISLLDCLEVDVESLNETAKIDLKDSLSCIKSEMYKLIKD